jgi:hypothetical protein
MHPRSEPLYANGGQRSYLEWTLHVEAAELKAFTQHVKEYHPSYRLSRHLARRLRQCNCYHRPIHHRHLPLAPPLPTLPTNVSSTEDPTQQPTIAHCSGHMHPHTHDATLKVKLISSIMRIYISDPSFAFASPHSVHHTQTRAPESRVRMCPRSLRVSTHRDVFRGTSHVKNREQ